MVPTAWPSVSFSVEIIPVHLKTHNHHPQTEDRPYDPKRKGRLPIVANPLCLKPCQRRFPVPDSTRWLVYVAIAVDTPSRSVELYRRFYEPCKVEDEQDERAKDDNARKELALQN